VAWHGAAVFFYTGCGWKTLKKKRKHLLGFVISAKKTWVLKFKKTEETFARVCDFS
jgi:hypothetical protein